MRDRMRKYARTNNPSLENATVHTEMSIQMSTDHKNRSNGLGQKNLTSMEERIGRTASGQYTLPEMFGNDWKNVLRPRALGKAVRESVRRGDLPDMEHAYQRSDRLHVYWIKRPKKL